MITLACWVVSMAGTLAVAALGPSAAVPMIPGGGGWPPYALNVHPPTGVVYSLQMISALAGAGAIWRMLTAARQHEGWDPRWLQAAGFLVASVLTVLPPAGGDVTSYLAYGYEAATGVNPYVLGPQSPGVPASPITDAVDAPWQTTPSVYGPAFTWVSSIIARAAGFDGHIAVTLTRLLMTGAFILTGLLLGATAGTAAGRRRVVVLWSANPLMILALVAGAHVDVLAALAIVCAIALVHRFPVGAGALVGLAAVTKLTGLVVLPGLLWVARSHGRRVLAILLGAAAVTVPWYAATEGAFTQLRRASRFSTPASPWRPLASLIQPALGYPTARTLTGALAGALGLALVVLLLRRNLPPGAASPVGRAAAITGAVAIGWLFTTPYVLPWYDALAWAPLALAAGSLLDRALLVHTAMLTIAFLPGRDVPLAGWTAVLNRVLHSGVSAVVLAVLAVVTVWLAARRPVDTSLLLPPTPAPS